MHRCSNREWKLQYVTQAKRSAFGVQVAPKGFPNNWITMSYIISYASVVETADTNGAQRGAAINYKHELLSVVGHELRKMTDKSLSTLRRGDAPLQYLLSLL